MIRSLAVHDSGAYRRLQSAEGVDRSGDLPSLWLSHDIW